MTYFAVIIQVLQPSDGNIPYVASAKEHFTCGETQPRLLFIQANQMINSTIKVLLPARTLFMIRLQPSGKFLLPKLLNPTNVIV